MLRHENFFCTTTSIWSCAFIRTGKPSKPSFFPIVFGNVFHIFGFSASAISMFPLWNKIWQCWCLTRVLHRHKAHLCESLPLVGHLCDRSCMMLLCEYLWKQISETIFGNGFEQQSRETSLLDIVHRRTWTFLRPSWTQSWMTGLENVFVTSLRSHRGKHFGGLRYAVRKSTCSQTPQWWRLTFNCTSKVISETFWMDKPGNLGWMMFPCHVEHLMWCKTLTWNDLAQRGWRSENPEQHECIYVNTYIFIIIWYNEI